MWTVPLDGSSNIILSTIEKGGGLADYCLWEGVCLESDCIREKDSPISKYQKGGTRHWFLCLIFLTKGEFYCSICNENF